MQKQHKQVKSKMCVKISTSYYNIVNSGYRRSASHLILDARPPDVGTFAVAPSIKAILPKHHHWVTISSHFKSYYKNKYCQYIIRLSKHSTSIFALQLTN